MCQIGSEQLLCSDVLFMFFFSEFDSYDGGELIVVDIYGEYEVKLLVGDMFVYVVSSLYWVVFVMCGVWLVSFFWIQSMVCGDLQCSMLFELDQMIQCLCVVYGDMSEVILFIGYYYNFLCMWVDI